MLLCFRFEIPLYIQLKVDVWIVSGQKIVYRKQQIIHYGPWMFSFFTHLSQREHGGQKKSEGCIQITDPQKRSKRSQNIISVWKTQCHEQCSISAQEIASLYTIIYTYILYSYIHANMSWDLDRLWLLLFIRHFITLVFQVPLFKQVFLDHPPFTPPIYPLRGSKRKGVTLMTQRLSFQNTT